MTPLQYFHYLKRIWKYRYRWARVCVLMRYCPNREDFWNRVNRYSPN